MCNLVRLGLMITILGLSGLTYADQRSSYIFLADNSDHDAKSQLMQGNKAPRVSNSKASSNVKSKHPGAKILSFQLIRSGGPAVYKFKLLRDGVVSFVYVDGNSGEVFE